MTLFVIRIYVVWSKTSLEKKAWPLRFSLLIIKHIEAKLIRSGGVFVISLAYIKGEALLAKAVIIFDRFQVTKVINDSVGKSVQMWWSSITAERFNIFIFIQSRKSKWQEIGVIWIDTILKQNMSTLLALKIRDYHRQSKANSPENFNRFIKIILLDLTFLIWEYGDSVSNNYHTLEVGARGRGKS